MTKMTGAARFWRGTSKMTLAIGLTAIVGTGALAAVGRGEEARRLLLLADRRIDEALRVSGGQVPDLFWASAAGTWAMLGRHDAAVTALARAVRNGWSNAELSAEDMPEDLAADPAFAGLRGDPRFEAIRAELNQRLAREKAEVRRAIA